MCYIKLFCKIVNMLWLFKEIDRISVTSKFKMVILYLL